MRPILIRAILFLISAFSFAGAAEPQRMAEKKLIEFGWDEPDTAFMRKHIAEMEATPFDGCVFHAGAVSKSDGRSFTWECWGTKVFTDGEMQSVMDDLKAIRFGRFRHNFLRFNVTPGEIDWFDDFSAVLNNARLAARAAFAGRRGVDGIMFDIEEYKGHLFDYDKQRDAKTKSWDAYAAQARLRGREVMEQFQAGYPGLTVFLTYGYCLPWRNFSDSGKPLAECEYGLLAPFLDGMVEAARGKTRLVDGYERSYGVEDPKMFREFYKTMQTDLLPVVANPAKYHRVFSFSFGIWMDRDWHKAGWNIEDPSKNLNPPEKLERLVRGGLQRADEYVWIYCEAPRWWSEEGKPLKLPQAYDAALRKARRAGNGDDHQ
ncbi:hypothetical protein HYR69_07645 [Candidatus Sumerlaeota bacterium]|nr:hypothetical protein [Candidatus Sumerlaeota bacterium]